MRSAAISPDLDCPHSLKSDNGPQFLSDEFQTFLQESGIEHRASPPLWPHANGEVELQNRTLLKALKVAQVGGKNWRKELPKFLLAYRSTPQVSTGSTSASLMFGRELKTKLLELRGERSVLEESSRDRDWQHKLKHRSMPTVSVVQQIVHLRQVAKSS